MAAGRWVEVRKRSGKAAKLNKLVGKNAATTTEGLVKAFQEDTERKRMMIRKTEATRNRLIFIVEALGQLSNDETFVALLEDEALAAIPTRLAERIHNMRIGVQRSEEHTSELQSLMRISYAVFCLKKKNIELN